VHVQSEVWSGNGVILGDRAIARHSTDEKRARVGRPSVVAVHKRLSSRGP
jgi:hypothetical protein